MLWLVTGVLLNESGDLINYSVIIYTEQLDKLCKRGYNYGRGKSVVGKEAEKGKQP